MKILKKAYMLGLIAVLLYVNSVFVFASDNGEWGLNIKNWIVKQASALSIAAIVIIIVPLIFKKAWSALIGTIFASGIALYVVNYPETLEKIGRTLHKIVFG